MSPKNLSRPYFVARRTLRTCRNGNPADQGLRSGIRAVHDKHVFVVDGFRTHGMLRAPLILVDAARDLRVAVLVADFIARPAARGPRPQRPSHPVSPWWHGARRTPGSAEVAERVHPVPLRPGKVRPLVEIVADASDEDGLAGIDPPARSTIAVRVWDWNTRQQDGRLGL